MHNDSPICCQGKIYISIYNSLDVNHKSKISFDEQKAKQSERKNNLEWFVLVTPHNKSDNKKIVPSRTIFTCANRRVPSVLCHILR